jgi:DNA-directed RNA polymerase III subunit RPC1
MKSSTLMLASFEMTTDHLYNSAVQCKQDDILGVSECIVMGNQAPIGTGLFKLAFHEAASAPQQPQSLLFDSLE